MKKSLTTHKGTYIELMFHIRISVLVSRLVANQTAQKSAQNRQKMTKIGTLSLVSRVTRALIIKLDYLIKNLISYQELDKILLSKQISWKNIEHSLTCPLKTSKINNFCLSPLEKRSHDSSLRALSSMKFFWKLSNRIISTRLKIICRVSLNVKISYRQLIGFFLNFAWSLRFIK